MKAICLDVETTTHSKGNCYDSRNYLVSIHAHYEGFNWTYRPSEIDKIIQLVEQSDLLIFFNAKFDIGWLRKHGCNFDDKKVYDVQLAHYYITNQHSAFPELNTVAEFYSLPGKVDKIAQYWADGVQTDDIPWEELKEYGERDVELTFQLYELQQDYFSAKKRLLFNLACQDLLVLQEMEWNGIHYDEETCNSKSQGIQSQVDKLLEKLSAVYPDVPINFDSNKQLSAFLYGGNIEETKRIFNGFYKTGKREGQARHKLEEVVHTLPRLFDPLKNTEMDAEGVFSVAEGTLRKLKGKKHKWIIDILIELAKLQKLNQTYYVGIPKLNQEMHWPHGILHPNYNQCATRTGRLSSSKPNGQNFSGDCLDVFVTRFHSVLPANKKGMSSCPDEALSTSG